MNYLDRIIAQMMVSKAKNRISKYCFEECKAYCCRKGYIVLDENNVDIVTQWRREELLKKGILIRLKDDRYSLYMGNSKYPCPSLSENKCLIHKNSKRPSCCKKFPIFIEGDYIIVCERCFAVKEKMFYGLIENIMKKGNIKMTTYYRAYIKNYLPYSSYYNDVVLVEPKILKRAYRILEKEHRKYYVAVTRLETVYVIRGGVVGVENFDFGNALTRITVSHNSKKSLEKLIHFLTLD